MIISVSKYNRSSLTDSQKEFFRNLVPLASLIQDWSQSKAQFLNIDSPVGIFPSLVMADIITASDCGEHPISKAKYGSRYSNNLSLLKSDKYWSGKSHTYSDGVVYRSYSDWRAFAVDYTDYLCFNSQYRDLLLSKNLLDQINIKSLEKINSSSYNSILISTIKSLGLEEFDGIQKRTF